MISPFLNGINDTRSGRIQILYSSYAIRNMHLKCFITLNVSGPWAKYEEQMITVKHCSLVCRSQIHVMVFKIMKLDERVRCGDMEVKGGYINDVE